MERTRSKVAVALVPPRERETVRRRNNDDGAPEVAVRNVTITKVDLDVLFRPVVARAERIVREALTFKKTRSTKSSSSEACPAYPPSVAYCAPCFQKFPRSADLSTPRKPWPRARRSGPPCFLEECRRTRCATFSCSTFCHT